MPEQLNTEQLHKELNKAMTTLERDKYIKQITDQLHQKRKLVSRTMETMKHSIKDNPLLEEIYNEHITTAKHSKKKTVDAFHNLVMYLKKLAVPDEDKHEKETDLKSATNELTKVSGKRR